MLLAWNPRESESLLGYKAQKEALDLGLAICKNVGINCIHLMVHCTGLVPIQPGPRGSYYSPLAQAQLLQGLLLTHQQQMNPFPLQLKAQLLGCCVFKLLFIWHLGFLSQKGWVAHTDSGVSLVVLGSCWWPGLRLAPLSGVFQRVPESESGPHFWQSERCHFST